MFHKVITATIISLSGATALACVGWETTVLKQDNTIVAEFNQLEGGVLSVKNGFDLESIKISDSRNGKYRTICDENCDTKLKWKPKNGRSLEYQLNKPSTKENPMRYLIVTFSHKLTHKLLPDFTFSVNLYPKQPGMRGGCGPEVEAGRPQD